MNWSWVNEKKIFNFSTVEPEINNKKKEEERNCDGQHF